LYPFTRSNSVGAPRSVFIDPRFSFGRPILKESRIATAVIAQRYKAGDSIAKDIQEKLGIMAPKQKNEGPAVLNITIGAGSVEIPMIEAEWSEVIEDENDS